MVRDMQPRGSVKEPQPRSLSTRSCMPNRGPVEFTQAECAALVDELGPQADLKDAEDAEERKRMTTMNQVRSRLAEVVFADGKGSVVVSTDEIEEMLDALGPAAGALAAVAKALTAARLHLMEDKGACNCGKD